MEKTTIWVGKDIANKLKEIGGTYEKGILKLMSSHNPGFARELKSLTYTVPAASKVTRDENKIVLDEDARIISVHIYFPPGCEDLVEVTMGVGNHVFAPKIVSGDGKSVSFEVGRFVPAKTPIWAEITNYDSTYEHTPTIEVEVELIREVPIV